MPFSGKKRLKKCGNLELYLVGQQKIALTTRKNVIKSALYILNFIYRRFHDFFTKPEVTPRKLTHPRHKYCSGHFFKAIFVFTTEKPMRIAANMKNKSRNVDLVAGLYNIQKSLSSKIFFK